MRIEEAQKQLAEAIRETDEYKYYMQCKSDAYENPTVGALLDEFSKLQTKLQMFALTGKEPDGEEMQRYQSLSALLFATPEASAFLLSKIQMQKKMADVFAYLSAEAGVPIDAPQI